MGVSEEAAADPRPSESAGSVVTDDLVLEIADLHVLASELIERWTDLGEDDRLAVLREIERQVWHLEGLSNGTPPARHLSLPLALTGRELEVLLALADTGTTARVAARLHISQSTVRSHVKSILAKLGVHSRTQAVVFALRHHLIPVPPEDVDET